jgi:hypothetical protein
MSWTDDFYEPTEAPETSAMDWIIVLGGCALILGALSALFYVLYLLLLMVMGKA